ncbi:hypothetical protein niasHT_004355 [Heterodera trifolii]|uniref:Ubiquitin-like domain-containing protein n=1 Tax=Heterodera trifolii TaxID=157864 RepID=A0ABD2MBX3_9BILA
MKQFCLSLFSVGISAGQITMLLLLMMMPSSTDGIEITVKADQKIFNESNQIAVVVQGSTTVEELKERIKEETGISPTKQTLKKLINPDGTATVLQDSETMAGNKIEEGAIILVFVNFEITVKADRMITLLSWTITVEVNGWDKVEDLKKNIIGKLSEKFKRKHGIEPEKISLQYGPNDDYDVLKDEKTIDDYHIKKGAIVHLSIAEFEIIVKQYGKKNEAKTYNVWVKREEIVAILKKKIENKSGIYPHRQILNCKTTDDPEMEDIKTLKEYGIENGTILFLSLEFEVVVEYVPNEDWKKYKIMVKKRDTLATLKDKIREKYTEDYNEYGFGTIELVKKFKTDEREPFVSLDDVELWHEDFDEYKTMDQCGIREGSMVSVFYARRLDKEEYDQGYYIRPWPTPKMIYL